MGIYCHCLTLCLPLIEPLLKTVRTRLAGLSWTEPDSLLLHWRTKSDQNAAGMCRRDRRRRGKAHPSTTAPCNHWSPRKGPKQTAEERTIPDPRAPQLCFSASRCRPWSQNNPVTLKIPLPGNQPLKECDIP